MFCGAGGFSCGLDSSESFETVLGVDFVSQFLETFEYNLKTETICGDLTDNNVKNKIIEKAREKGVNMIIGGPPCQGFSLKGKNLGLDDPRNFLFKEYVHIVKRLKPEVFVIENVKNLLNACEGYFLKQIVTEMESIGYIVNSGVLDATDFGVPEHRERAIIIGSLSRSVPLPERNVDTFTTVRDAISDLAYLNSGEGSDISVYKNEPMSDYQKKLRNPTGKLFNHKATSHSKIALEKLRMIPPEGDKTSLPIELHGKQKFATTWSRLVWDLQSPTIDTRFDTPSNGRNSHPELHRAITPREAARIQSFPDSYKFLGKKGDICKQIGNAVPPLMAKAIGESILSAYRDERCGNNRCSLYLGDSTKLVKELKKNGIKVNHIITDPPYRIAKENNFTTMKNKRVGIDFGTWDNAFDVCGWIGDFVDILDENGSMIIFCSYRYISFIVDELEKNGMEAKDIIVWQKSNPMPRNINRRYVQDMEFAIWSVKKKGKWTFNKPEDVPYLRSLFTSSLVSGVEKLGHPTQKSLKIMENIIKIHTNENDLILDPFMGSGTTGEACLKNNRKFIGIEVVPKYFDMCKKRILKENTKMKV